MHSIDLADFPPELQATISRRYLASGQILLHQGEAADNLYWVATGQLHLASFVNHRTITHYFVEAGELLGETALQFDTYGCTAIAEIPSEVIAIPKGAFAEALRQSPVFSERYLAYLTHRFQAVKTLVELRGVSSARDRLLHYLMKRCPPGQDTVILDKPLKTIASELALTPEGLSRLLARLQAEGTISRKQRSITLSKEWLENISEWHELSLG